MKPAEICVRVPPEVRRLFKRLAHRRERSVNELLAVMIRQEIAKEADLAKELPKEAPCP